MTGVDLKRFSLFADLSDEEREELAGCLETRGFETGETLFEQGEEADSLVLVESGDVQLSSSWTEERGRLTAGAALGGLALFRAGVREATATAREPARVLLLSRKAYRRLVDERPRAACRLAEAVLKQVASRCGAVLGRLKGGAG